MLHRLNRCTKTERTSTSNRDGYYWQIVGDNDVNDKNNTNDNNSNDNDDDNDGSGNDNNAITTTKAAVCSEMTIVPQSHFDCVHETDATM